ncbi:hypothetical protein A2W14_04855 [Candidatus Gottesmanbacteria bacterium RBG_16_37_8]|uniref:Antitoxin n=1 Tax=Candidatus Gottesmanbacteria bacterium RBG_16_37_8 TaxID=1798371 RepID=A0A1F5YVC3_9BACT|nr:MAG: hypothetical protein A2W14_04855 [Candidatus Gottesmanbacteria bacterium RBG_16_37_8]
MINQQTISTISELRFKTKEVLKKVKEAPVYLFHRSVPQGVILSLEKYQEMMEALEDYYLSLRAEEYERQDKNQIKWVSHEEVKKHIRGQS